MREALIRKFQARVELVPSGGGAFEIAVDGRLVYSKKALGRFPTDEEIDRLDRRPAL